MGRNNRQAFGLVKKQAQEALKSLGVVTLQYADKETQELIAGYDYTEFPGIGLAKNIDLEKKIPEQTILLMESPKGVVIDRHSHPNKELLLVLEGQMKIYLDHETVTVRKHGFYLIESQVFHKVEFTELTNYIILWDPFMTF